MGNESMPRCAQWTGRRTGTTQGVRQTIQTPPAGGDRLSSV